MKLNTDKCHLLISESRYEHFWAQIGKDNIWEGREVKLLGIILTLILTLIIFALKPIKSKCSK